VNSASDKVAILVTDWWAQESAQPRLTDTRPLLPLLDKPMLQLAVERLVALGCEEFHVLLGDDPTAVREFLDTGERWGVTITCHYRNAEFDLARNLKPLSLSPEKYYWLACPDRLPASRDTAACDTAATDAHAAAGVALCWQADSRPQWTGWGCFTGAFLRTLHQTRSFAELEQLFVEDRVIRQFASPPLDVTSDREFLRSSLQILNERSDASSQAVRVGRGAVIHADAGITGPAYIGRQARIEAGAKLGPNVIVCDGAVIDREAELADCIVLPDTYVGAQLQLKLAIAAPGRLSSIANDVVVNRIEPMLLASVNGSGNQTRGPVVATLALKAALFPLSALARWIGRRAQLAVPDANTMQVPDLASAQGAARDYIRIGVADTLPGIYANDRGAWVAHFLYTFYPGLDEVARGTITLCGPELRDDANIARLPEHWKVVYSRHRCGLLSESMLLPRDAATHGGRYACDAYAVAESSTAYRRRILLDYLGRVCADCFKTMFGAREHKTGDAFSPTPKQSS
jgi:hypothetical protein